MPVITSIEPQKNNAHRFNIYVDNTFMIGVHEDTLVALQLQKGMPFTDLLKQKITRHSDYHYLYTVGLNYISYGLKTKKQVYDKLMAQLGNDEDNLEQHQKMVDLAIKKLMVDKYIDDDYFVQAFLNTNQALGKKGEHFIIQKLLSLGIDRDIIKAHLLQKDTQDFVDAAIELARAYFKKQKTHSYKESVARVKKHLAQKGYSYDVIDRALQNAQLQKSSKEEYAAIVYQSNQLFKKYRKQVITDEVFQKVKQALFQKGFSSTLINTYLNDYQENL